MAAPPVGSGTTFLQAKTANEVLKAQERRLRLQKLKGELIDRAPRAVPGVSVGAAGTGCLGQLARTGGGFDGG